MIDDVITYGAWLHLYKKYSLTVIVMNLQWHKTREKDVVGIVAVDLIVLLPTNHIIILQRHTGVYEETLDVNTK